MKIPEQYMNDVTDVVLLFLLLIWNKFHTSFLCSIVEFEQGNFGWKVVAYKVQVYCFPEFKFQFGIIYLELTQNFPKNSHFLPPDTSYTRHATRTRKCAYQGVINMSFRKFIRKVIRKLPTL